MLLSLGWMLLGGFALGAVMQRLRLPALLGMMVAGMLLGPYGLDWIDPAIQGISLPLREIALVVILLRAGLALDTADLRAIGRPAVLLCFLPATFEWAAVWLLAPLLLGITRLEAAILGAVLAAVSPAVVVPRMLTLMAEGYGQARRVPQLVMAGASVDDVYVIVLFTAFTGMAGGQAFGIGTLLRVPVSIVAGIVLGLLVGLGVAWALRRVHMRATEQALVLLGICLLLVAVETAVRDVLPLSGLLAVMALGVMMRKRDGALAGNMARKYEKIWVAAQWLLFVLVGAAVDIRAAGQVGLGALGLIVAALACRAAGVWLSLVGTAYQAKERLFIVIAYMPKATVQAAIGGIPLALGIPAGETILAVAVLAILITAPLGAVGIDRTYRRLLERG